MAPRNKKKEEDLLFCNENKHALIFFILFCVVSWKMNMIDEQLICNVNYVYKYLLF